MSIFKKSQNQGDLEGELKASATQIEELEAQLAQATNEVKTATESAASLAEQLTEAKSENEGLTEKVSSLTDDLATANASLQESEANQSDFEARVDAAAAAKLGDLGGEGIPALKGSSDSKEDLEAQYLAMSPGKERIEFRAKHPELFYK